MRAKQTLIILLIPACFLIGCNEPKPAHTDIIQPVPTFTTPDKIDSNSVELVFSLQYNRDVYEESDWGEPPQLALWLEDPSGQQIRTVWVTYRTASGDWAGKVECPVALPFWVSRYNKESQTFGPPTVLEPAPDAVTGATPKNEPFQIIARVKPGSQWTCFIEVNCSGDYNRAFPSVREDGGPDPNGNGQPSLVWRGDITARPGQHCQPVLIGRTDQWRPVAALITDLDGITSARNLLSTIQVNCR